MSGLELHPSGRRLLVTSADLSLRLYLLHRPGERQPLRRARGQGQGGSGGGAAQEQLLAPAEWDVIALEDARRAVAGGRQPCRSSLFYDDSASWLTFHFNFVHGMEKRPWGCAAFSPGARCW